MSIIIHWWIWFANIEYFISILMNNIGSKFPLFHAFLIIYTDINILFF